MFIALILKNDKLISNLGDFESLWTETTKIIQQERNIKIENSFYEVVDNLRQEQLTSILKKIPEDELFKLLEQEEII